MVGSDAGDGSLRYSDSELDLEQSSPALTIQPRSAEDGRHAFASASEEAPSESGYEASIGEDFVHASDMSEEEEQ